ncbi:LysR family transcriptional regulator [Polyangium jinanense]|uniref:LysR family transcriptional regulator n=1 Tax=Polyangium jinanense TaxID=2829994 RepID=A0A9X4AR68_9BACT|nr:LysR family transcriptional regulator [Polyangium jinanense]MDC3955089.1 LysR family transcriptional regulator [Polyangium jinanense]MDC3981141.1 LysR family transcriptional regulator [Polyangium jinanense]
MTAALDDVVSMAVFARVVEARSFTGAAALLGLSKSVVSARISGLEERLGVRLLHRTTRRLSLTEEGARLYETCARLVSAADEAQGVLESASAEPEGLVRVTVPVGTGILQFPSILRELHERYPRLVIELSLSEHRVDIVAEGYDVAIRVADTLEDSALVARRIGSVRMIVCASPDYLDRRGRPVSPRDLVHHNCLRLSPVRREWSFRCPGRRTQVVPVTGTLITDNIAVLRQAALDGIGVARLPLSYVAADIEAGRLRRVLPEHALGETNVFVVHPYQRHMPTKVRAFVDYVVQRFRSASDE